jgi:low temperature requirement protein LtrA
MPSRSVTADVFRMPACLLLPTRRSGRAGDIAMSVIKIAPPQLRTRETEGHRTATWLELFYDLAFVVAVAVIAGRLGADVSWSGVASYFGYFALLWWLWASHTYYADRYDTDDLVYRLLAAGQMVAIVVIAASLSPDAAGSTRAFAYGYAASRWLLVVMYWRAFRHVEETRVLVKGYLTGFGVAALIWTASALVPNNLRVSLWVAALFVDLATPWIMRKEQARVPFDVSHLPERFGLFTILVLGESIAAVVMGLSHSEWAIVPTTTAAVGIGVATAMWWLYFDNARGSVVRRDASVRRTWRPTAWIYTHLLLAGGLAASGVGIEIAVAESSHGPMPSAERWLLVGSVVFVFLALAVIQLAAIADPSSPGRQIIFARLLGVPFLLIIGLLSDLEAQWVAGGVLGVCVAELIADMSSPGARELERGGEIPND